MKSICTSVDLCARVRACVCVRVCAHLALAVLAVLVGGVVVHGVGWRAVGGWAVGLGAGQAWQSLQTLGTVAAGRHADPGFQASCQGGEGEVTLGLVRDAAWVQQAHDLAGDMEGGLVRIESNPK